MISYALCRVWTIARNPLLACFNFLYFYVEIWENGLEQPCRLIKLNQKFNAEKTLCTTCGVSHILCGLSPTNANERPKTQLYPESL